MDNEKSESKMERIKKETLELYKQLPPDEEGRKKRIDIRDKVIELNYSFFGYVASHTFINNPSVTYEDKLQSALMHFCECWWWYQYSARYRCDLSFTVFFRPRIQEMIERELNEVKYSIRRSLCMEVGQQLGKHWGKVTYDDLAHVDLPADKMNSLKAIFGTLYWADLETHEIYIESDEKVSTFNYPGKHVKTLEEFLMKEMCDLERRLTDKDLIDISEKLNIDFWKLKKTLPEAEKKLYINLKDSVDAMQLD